MNTSRGSEWHRWDVHIHSPGTALADEYPLDSWGEYVRLINAAQPAAIALGVTDYLSLRSYGALRKRFGGNIMYFPLSSVSLIDAELGEKDLKKRTLAPFGLVEPFLWLLHMHGFCIFEDG